LILALLFGSLAGQAGAETSWWISPGGAIIGYDDLIPERYSIPSDEWRRIKVLPFPPDPFKDISNRPWRTKEEPRINDRWGRTFHLPVKWARELAYPVDESTFPCFIRLEKLNGSVVYYWPEQPKGHIKWSPSVDCPWKLSPAFTIDEAEQMLNLGWEYFAMGKNGSIIMKKKVCD